MKRRSERGSALVLAVLILSAMLALGLMAMHTTTQTVAGSGNLKLSKQARYIAEAGLFHANTLFNSDPNVMQLRESTGCNGDCWIKVTSDGDIDAYSLNDPEAEDPLDQPEGFVEPASPDFFGGATPNALGVFGETSGLVASYYVRVEGFEPVSDPPGQSSRDGYTYCLLEFTSFGYVASEAVAKPADYQNLNFDRPFAEHAVKSAMYLAEVPNALCGS
ncbi:MAG: pilus assembly PilX N-terminal domain-containing protein [Bradymonadia bacterium]